jgi:hypothetical protein
LSTFPVPDEDQVLLRCQHLLCKNKTEFFDVVSFSCTRINQVLRRYQHFLCLQFVPSTSVNSYHKYKMDNIYGTRDADNVE